MPHRSKHTTATGQVNLIKNRMEKEMEKLESKVWAITGASNVEHVFVDPESADDRGRVMLSRDAEGSDPFYTSSVFETFPEAKAALIEQVLKRLDREVEALNEVPANLREAREADDGGTFGIFEETKEQLIERLLNQLDFGGKAMTKMLVSLREAHQLQEQ